MPNDALCQQIADAVEELREAHPRQVVVRDGRQVRESLEDYFAQILYPALHQQFPDISDVVLGVVGLMAYLGPQDAGFPLSPLRDELILHALKYKDDPRVQHRPGWLVELALAYGCGWRRSARSGAERWDNRWPGAVQELTDIACNFVVQTTETLVATVRRFRPDWDEVRGDAAWVVAEFTKQPDQGAAQYKHYQTTHRWDPPTGNLYGWLKRVVRGGGSQQGRLQPNWFQTGLLFICLKNSGRLDVGKAAFQRCRQCASSVTEYTAPGTCAQCGELTFIFHKTLLIVPGVYTGQPFWRCPAHEYNWERYPNCPSCNEPRPKKPGWRCRCGKQHKWLENLLACPACGMAKPKQITWTCHNHYYQLNLLQCPGPNCDEPRPDRPTTLLVHR